MEMVDHPSRPCDPATRSPTRSRTDRSRSRNDANLRTIWVCNDPACATSRARQRLRTACAVRVSLSPPGLRERCHRGLARRLEAISWPAVLVLPEGQGPQPWTPDRRGVHLHDAADDCTTRGLPVWTNMDAALGNGRKPTPAAEGLARDSRPVVLLGKACRGCHGAALRPLDRGTTVKGVGNGRASSTSQRNSA